MRVMPAGIRETLNMIDTGSAILLDNPVRIDFNAETAIEALAETLRRWGCPQKMSFDRDPRFVGAWTAGDFPSPLTKLLMCLMQTGTGVGVGATAG